MNTHDNSFDACQFRAAREIIAESLSGACGVGYLKIAKALNEIEIIAHHTTEKVLRDEARAFLRKLIISEKS